ncbi:MAG: PVC-type heme-binding CxxCH protein, partial [Verrucomicrobiota bacterium]
MKLPNIVTILAGLTLIASAEEDDRLVRASDPQSPEDELKGFSLPDGFEISLFAAEPMINKPINLAVDDQGRVWVSSTVEYPYAAERDRWEDELGSRVRDSRDAIKILEDTDGDGRADTVSDFADGLNIPTGVLPYTREGDKLGCIAWSIPNIWYLADTTGNGKADHREVLFGPLGYEKDTHGMCSSFRLGPDGWVYATHGFNNTSKLVARDGSKAELKSGNVFRFRPDASSVEVWSRGQVNPFGLAFDHRGLLYSADCHTAPVYQLIQGATYPHFSNPEPAVGFGPTMIEHTHGSTGICGIVYVDRGRWGQAWDDHVVIGNPVNSQVHLDRIEFTGSTPKAIEKPDLVTSEDRWFRPVDLCFGINGELYIADFYNRIIGHYEVDLDHPGRDRERGRIWRITHREQTAVKPVRPGKITSDLSAEDPFVRRRAAQQLRIEPEVGRLQELAWVLGQTPDEDTHLRHTLRLAILETLKLDGAIENLDEIGSDFRPLLRDVPNADAAAFLAKQSGLKPQELTHIARYGD